MLAIIHDHVDLVRKPIIGKLGDHTPNGTPFTVTSVKHPDSTSYEPFEVEFIGLFLNSYIYRICSTFRSNVRIPIQLLFFFQGRYTVRSFHWTRKTKFTSSFLCFHLIPKVRILNTFLNGQNRHFFTLLCFTDDGKKKIGKSWSLLVYIAPTKTKFIEAEEMANFGKFVDFQVLSEVRRSRVLKHESRPDKFKYPMYKNEEQNGPDLKETYEKCREKWGDNFLHYVLCNLLQYEEKDLTLEQPEQ